MPLSDFSDWPVDDREAAVGLRIVKSETCGECGVHPSSWKADLGGDPNAVVPVWRHCRVCELIANAREAGPPGDEPGWHLELQHKH